MTDCQAASVKFRGTPGHPPICQDILRPQSIHLCSRLRAYDDKTRFTHRKRTGETGDITSSPVTANWYAIAAFALSCWCLNHHRGLSRARQGTCTETPLDAPAVAVRVTTALVHQSLSWVKSKRNVPPRTAESSNTSNDSTKTVLAEAQTSSLFSKNSSLYLFCPLHGAVMLHLKTSPSPPLPWPNNLFSTCLFRYPEIVFYMKV